MELIELLPELGKACICLGCVDAYKRDPVGFMKLIQTGPA